MLSVRGLGGYASGVIGICVFLLGLSSGARADRLEHRPPFSLPATELLALKSRAVPESSDVEVLLFDVHWDFDTQGKLKETFRYVYRIRTQRGADGWASTSMTFHPWHQKPARIRARVVTPDGVEHVLDPSTLVESAAGGTGGATYSDRRRLSGPLPAIRPGAVVEEWLEVEEHRPYFDAGQVKRLAVAPHAYTALWRLTVTAPTRLPLRYRLRGSRKKPKQRVAQGRRIWTFEYRDQLPVYRWPSAATDPNRALVPTIEVSSGRSWQAVATAYHEAVEAQLAGFDAAAISGPLAPAGAPRDEVISALVRHVHAQVRYTGLELGERSLIPTPPGETLARKYGDCKDKASLLVALLRSRGIDAHVALLAAGGGLDVPQQLPGLGLFNHAIVYVPGPEPLFIDATAERAEVGTLPFDDQDRLALVAAQGQQELMLIPSVAAADNLMREDIYITYVDGEPGRVREITTATGPIGSELRFRYEGDEDDLRKKFKEYIEGRYGGSLARAVSRHTQDVEGLVELDLEVHDSSIHQTMTDGAWVGLGPQGIFEHVPGVLYEEESGKGDTAPSAETEPGYKHLPAAPVYATPHTRLIAYHLTAPEGYVYQQLPEDRTWHVGGLSLWRQVRRESKRAVHVEFGLRSEQALFGVDALEKVRDTLSAFDDSSGVHLRFHFEPDALIAQGKVQEGMALYRTFLQQRPQDILLRTRYAQALIGLGFGDEARKVAEETARRWPKSAAAQWSLGIVLMYDHLGRDSWPEADFRRSVEAVQRAVELEPDSRLYREALMVVLPFCLQYDRCGPGDWRALLRAALLEHRERFGDEIIDNDFRVRLFRVGAFEELLDLIPNDATTEVDRLGYLSALLATKGYAAMLRKAVQFAGGPPHELLTGVASAMLLVGQLDLAASVLKHPEIEKSARYAKIKLMYDALAGRAECLASMSPAARAVHELAFPILRSAQGAPMTEALGDSPKTPHFHMASTKHVLRTMLVDNDNTRGLATDGMACLMQWSTDGEHGAYRVRVHGRNLPVSRSATTFYLRKKGNRWVVVGAQNGDDMGALGRQAMHAMLTRNPAQARTWLTWAEEHLEKLTTARERYSKLSAYRAIAQTPLDSAGDEELWLRAAMLSSWSPMGAPEAKVLRRALARETDAARKTALQYRLASVLGTTHDHATSSQLYGAVAEALPEDRGVRENHIWQLHSANLYDRALAELDDYEQRYGEAPAWLSTVRTHAWTHQGQFERALAAMQASRAAGTATPEDMANVAWHALFSKGDLAPAIALGESSVALREKESSVHTLAALYLEHGDVDKAHRLLAKTREIDTDGSHDEYTWYLVGRLAELLGLQHNAKLAFRRQHRPDHVQPCDTYNLYLQTRAAH